MGRRLDPLVAQHLPADVDLQGGVRRVRPHHCAQEVFLRAQLIEASCNPGLGLCRTESTVASMFTAAPWGKNSTCELEGYLSTARGCGCSSPVLMVCLLLCTVNNRAAFVTPGSSVIHRWN